ncbi:uncharacterized protein KGF55_004737 [Candida pseudojiufengensis]|uniref:uncharacterized protein n=1 Tax=Candida pseudojiufengensis TaxID=497109 RepID=UPI002225104F|nr:uncharacterized protein KGF55_004737 [Candida pseudojiufengensis]KAI5960444.1 hypothetical protein KGF55_004737 [Candida pseudojiufengensis]
MSLKRTSEAFKAASDHWAKKQKKDNSVIEINSSDSEDHQPLPTIPGKIVPSPIKLLYNPSYPENELKHVNQETVRIQDLIGSKSLVETFQFNFNVDLPFFLTFLDSSFTNKKKKIVFITGSRLLDPEFDETEFIKSKFNISEVVANIPNRFGTHHSKMMINFFENDTVEIVIMSANITRLDFGGLTQMVWRSGRLKKGSTQGTKSSRFKLDLLSYLKKYNKSRIDELSSRLDEYDFSGINVDLIASAPGSYDLNDSGRHYGYGSLYDVLKRNNLLIQNSDKEKHYNVLAQVSAISYPFSTEKWATAGIFTHLLCPLIFSKFQEFKLLQPGKDSIKTHQHENNYTPSIVFPTVDEVAQSNVGFMAGQAIHFNYTKSFVHKNYFNQAIRPYLRKWNSSGTSIITGREKVVPHVKLYMCDNGDDWKTLKWCYMGSHNLSKQAWGSKKGNAFKNDDPSQYEVSSYELGVLVTPEEGTLLRPSYLKDENVEEQNSTFIRMPFKLPAKTYSDKDLPWSGHVNYGEKTDTTGRTYNI